MTSIEGAADPIENLPARRDLPADYGTKVLNFLREADEAETRAIPVPVVSRPSRPWFRDDADGEPWTTPRAKAVIPERRAERTGYLKIPALFAFDSLRQQIGMMVRDALRSLSETDQMSGIMGQHAWNQITRNRDELRAEMTSVAEEDRHALEVEINVERGLHRELLAKLDTLGLAMNFPGSVARRLGRDLVRAPGDPYRASPWAAAVVLTESANPVHWSPSPGGA